MYLIDVKDESVSFIRDSQSSILKRFSALNIEAERKTIETDMSMFVVPGTNSVRTVYHLNSRYHKINWYESKKEEVMGDCVVVLTSQRKYSLGR